MRRRFVLSAVIALSMTALALPSQAKNPDHPNQGQGLEHMSTVAQQRLAELGLDPERLADVSVYEDAGSAPDWSKLVDVEIVAAPAAPDENTEFWGSGLYVKNVSGWCCEAWYYRTRVVGNGPGTLSFKRTLTSSNTFSASVGIDYKLINAKVGFDVTHETSAEYSKSVTVPSGKCYQIRAYDIKIGKTFEIWDDPWIGSDKKVGSGTARKFDGVALMTFTYC